MKASELRIGNLVFLKSKNEVYEISSGHDIEEIDDAPEMFDAVPIPLNQSWVKFCGFEDDIDSLFKFLSLHEFCTDKLSFRKSDKGYVCLEMRGYETLLPNIKHVHELQNLYFALTGKELQIN